MNWYFYKMIKNSLYRADFDVYRVNFRVVIMKNNKDFYGIIIFIFILLQFIPIILFIKITADFKDFEAEFQNERMIQNKNIEQLEMEIRLLKQDIFILENGYEVGKY